MTTDGGATWKLRRSAVPGWFRVTRPFAIDPTDPKKAYLTVGWFGVEQLLYTKDAGANWRSLDGDLPDIPVHCVDLVTGQGKPNVLFVGTERGVWRSTDHGVHWEYYGSGLPNAPVIDLRVDEKRKRIVIATQGRGAWEIGILARNQLDPMKDTK